MVVSLRTLAGEEVVAMTRSSANSHGVSITTAEVPAVAFITFLYSVEEVPV